MRTLHVITDRDRRGAQVHALELADGLLAAGIGATVLALAPGIHDDLLDVEALGRQRRSVHALRALRERAKDFDVVVAHGSTTLPACALALPRTQPFVYRQISDPLFWAGSWHRRLRTALFLRRARAIVALSSSIVDVLTRHYRLPASRIAVIPNAVPGGDWPLGTPESRRAARSPLGLPADGFVGISLSALVEEKGVDTAIRAIAPHRHAHLVVVGDGPERERLEGLATSVAPGRVQFLRAVERPQSVLGAADAMLLASRGGDSMPAALIEAGLSGIPSITTSVGAIEDVVINSQTGLVVQPGDELAFIRAVEDLISDMDLSRAWGVAAQEHCAARFTIDAVVPDWVELFHAVTG